MTERSISTLKTQLRHDHLARRRQLDPGTVLACAKQVEQLWIDTASHMLLPRLQEAQGALALYAAVRNELPVEALAQWAIGHNIRVCYPQVTSTTTMCFIEITPSTRWVVGRYGIRTPEGTECDPASIAVVALPGTAFDAQGHRLGMGGGFYDRWLQQPVWTHRSPICIGVCYDWQRVDHVPYDDHDVQMDYLLTPTEWVVC